MARLLIDTQTREIFLDGNDTIISFNGTPLDPGGRQLEPIGRPVRCLADWRSDPGAYYPAAFLLCTIVPQNSPDFIAGGSFLYIYGWCGEYNARLAPGARLYDDRQVVRDLAEQLGGVAW